ncbi:MAG: nucleoside recognition protein [Clostridia bacterium]|nr:nucleoside recognition protein [Clostridia bacterium]
MNNIWVFMIIISIIVGLANGKAPDMVNSIIESTKLATENSTSIIGMICFWAGIMKIAEETGVIKKLSKLVNPILKVLFPKLKDEGEAKGFIALNMTANILGLGNVATPLGLNAMKQMQQENPNKDTLTNEMIMLIVINTASIQLIPTSIIALRAAHHSENPVIVVVPILIASFISLVTGIILVKIKCKKVQGRKVTKKVSLNHWGERGR